jgi:thioredoxin-related protein
LQKRFIMIVILIVCLSVLLTACGNTEQREVLATVRNFAKYTTAEDSGKLFLLYHQNVRTLDLKNVLDLQFSLYDIKYDIEKLELEKIEDGYAYAPFIATMKKTDGSDFRDIRITGTFVLTKEGDDWKILTIDYVTEALDE